MKITLPHPVLTVFRTRPRILVCCFALILLCMGPLAPADAETAETPWPMPIPGWQPVQPNEHPRLLFRQADIPELRRRAQTEEGQAILNRLRATLGGGETMPEFYSEENPLRYGDGRNRHHPQGTFTTWHGAGFGFLYVITGEEKYAQLSREALEKSACCVAFTTSR